jgi:hypothetical protein
VDATCEARLLVNAAAQAAVACRQRMRSQGPVMRACIRHEAARSWTEMDAHFRFGDAGIGGVRPARTPGPHGSVGGSRPARPGFKGATPP